MIRKFVPGPAAVRALSTNCGGWDGYLVTSEDEKKYTWVPDPNGRLAKLGGTRPFSEDQAKRNVASGWWKEKTVHPDLEVSDGL